MVNAYNPNTQKKAEADVTSRLSWDTNTRLSWDT